MIDRIDPRVELFLGALRDGRWHERIPPRVSKKVPLYVIDFCWKYLGVTECRLIRIRGSRGSRALFRITDRGRKALRHRRSPTPMNIARLRYGDPY